MAETHFKKPTSAFSLYVRLYCNKRKGKSKFYSSTTEATKSWLMLSKADKEIFLNKYNDYCEKVRKSYANNLKNIEPFLKLKKQRKLPEVVDKDICGSSHNEVLGQDKSMNTTYLNLQNEMWSEHGNEYEESERNLMENQCERLPEPIIPTIRTAKDLFDLISTLHEGTDSNWKHLSSSQKNRYKSATLALKKDYISKYKNYLESLPSQDLFEHYWNKIDECD